jgi:hypothetical protein
MSGGLPFYGGNYTMETANSKIIEKIRKLLSLGACNPNENEAQAAILKAHALMAEYGIDMVSAEEQAPSYTKRYCTHKGNRKFRKNLASVIAPNFRCETFFHNGQVVFFGRSGDAAIAGEVFEYAYRFAYKESNRMYAQLRREGFSGEGVINSYAIGFICGLKEKLDEQSTALLVVVPADVADEYADMAKGWRTSTFRLAAGNGGNRDAYERGRADGRAVMNRRMLEPAE